MDQRLRPPPVTPILPPILLALVLLAPSGASAGDAGPGASAAKGPIDRARGTSSSASASDAGPRRDVASVALERVEALAATPPGAERGEAIELARLALGLAGPSVVEPLAQRLGDADEARAQALAWALGESARDLPSDRAGLARRAQAIAALTETLWTKGWSARLTAASALGLLEAREAELDLVALAVHASAAEQQARAAGLPPQPGRGGVVLLALAGTGGEVARAVIAEELAAGGDARWARSMLAIHARIGPACWPEVTEALARSDRTEVRMTAAAILLVLAEPASAGAIAQAAECEADAGIRLTLIQALAATSAPRARQALAALASEDPDPRLARAARLVLVEGPEPRLELDPRVDSARVREALQLVAQGRAFPRDLRDIEAGATSLELDLMTRAMRALPLREDGAWMDDLARLAQARARVLCATWPGGIPQGSPRVGRPAPR